MANKYHARKTKIDNYVFDSQREAERYAELKLMESANEICALKVHPTFLLQEGFLYHGKYIRPIIYIADFQYMKDGKFIVEDVKGIETQAFRIKWKMLLFANINENIEFRIVK